MEDNMEYILLETPLGKLRGIVQNDWKSNIFYSFLSIPYAKPPLGALRFEAPEESKPWKGVLDATKDLPKAPQVDAITLKMQGTEDCLYLNLHTPQIPTDKSKDLNLLPVLVFIHGGGFILGSGSCAMYGPHILISEGVIVITINYRLGMLGSLSAADQSILCGNAGMKDQVMALRWINRNIENFGGDPKNVTIMGESSGAASVHLHVLSPMSRGLFHKAIMQSGCALANWSNGYRDTVTKCKNMLKIPSDNTKQIIQELKTVSAETIIRLSRPGLIYPLHSYPETSPVVEYQTNKPAFLPDEPINIIRSGNYTKVPMLIGYNDKDGMLVEVLRELYRYKQYAINLNNLQTAIPKDLEVDDPDMRNEIVQKIQQFYFKEKAATNDDFLTRIDLQTDTYFMYGINKTVEEHLKTSNTPIYYFRFSSDTKLNFFKRISEELTAVPGASHIDDLGYLFKHKLMEDVVLNSIEDICMKRMVKLWTNFAKYGNPTPTPSDPLLNIKWSPATRHSLNYLDISSNLKMSINPDRQRVDFWDHIYLTYKKKQNKL